MSTPRMGKLLEDSYSVVCLYCPYCDQIAAQASDTAVYGFFRPDPAGRVWLDRPTGAVKVRCWACGEEWRLFKLAIKGDLSRREPDSPPKKPEGWHSHKDVLREAAATAAGDGDGI